MKSPDALRRAVEKWAETALAAAKPMKSIDIHADELARLVGSGPDDLLQLAWSAYIELVSIVQPHADAHMPMLSIDLEPSEVLDVRLPPTANLRSQLSREPPSLYIVHRDGDRLLHNFERYRCPFVSVLESLEHAIDGLYAFYECSRSEQAQRLGWEYNRKIYVEYYPSILIPK